MRKTDGHTYDKVIHLYKVACMKLNNDRPTMCPSIKAGYPVEHFYFLEDASVSLYWLQWKDEQPSKTMIMQAKYKRGQTSYNRGRYGSCCQCVNELAIRKESTLQMS